MLAQGRGGYSHPPKTSGNPFSECKSAEEAEGEECNAEAILRDRKHRIGPKYQRTIQVPIQGASGGGGGGGLVWVGHWSPPTPARNGGGEATVGHVRGQRRTSKHHGYAGSARQQSIRQRNLGAGPFGGGNDISPQERWTGWCGGGRGCSYYLICIIYYGILLSVLHGLQLKKISCQFDSVLSAASWEQPIWYHMISSM